MKKNLCLRVFSIFDKTSTVNIWDMLKKKIGVNIIYSIAQNKLLKVLD